METAEKIYRFHNQVFAINKVVYTYTLVANYEVSRNDFSYQISPGENQTGKWLRLKNKFLNLLFFKNKPLLYTMHYYFSLYY